jgi:REP element-mobilizing transposase RayT
MSIIAGNVGNAGLRTRLSSENANAEPRGWHSRGYIPHFDSNDVIQHVTFHLADSLPKKAVEQLLLEIQELDPDQRAIEQRRRLEALIDAGHGSCWLQQPDCARIVQDALLHFDGERYRMIAWVVMPNHVHALFQTMEGWSMNTAVSSWKTFTANAIGRIVRQPDEPAPHVWHPEFWDRFIRDQKHFASVLNYIHNNPVKAGLVSRPEDWLWSSANPGNVGNAGLRIQSGNAGLRTRPSSEKASTEPRDPGAEPRDPLHGITLEKILIQLVADHGWEEMGERIKIRCFQNDPSIKSSLTFLRKTPWAREKVEKWFVADARRRRRGR